MMRDRLPIIYWHESPRSVRQAVWNALRPNAGARTIAATCGALRCVNPWHCALTNKFFSTAQCLEDRLRRRLVTAAIQLRHLGQDPVQPLVKRESSEQQ